MRTHNFKRDIDYRLFYGLIIAMVLVLGIFAEKSLGVGGSPCSPCDTAVYDWNGHFIKCVGCITDCGVCYDCNTSTTPPSCHEKYDQGAQDCCPNAVTGKCKSICDWKHACMHCDSNDSGNCKSVCDPCQCQTCDGSGNCPVCNGDPNQKCCDGTDGTCYPKCKLTDGEVCADPNGSYPQCNTRCVPMFGSGVGCDGEYSREYKGWTEKKCSGGCPGECEPNDKVCYIKKECQTVWMPVSNQQCVFSTAGCSQINEPSEGVWCFFCEVMPDSECKIERSNDSCGG